MLAQGYTIRFAQPAETTLLTDIERRASLRFDDYLLEHGMGQVMAEVLTPPDWLAESIAEQRLWVVCTGDNHPVGFALACDVDSNAHLDELDVLVEHGRQGLGAALVETACDWGRAHGFKAITLTTLSNVPWNAPFYERLGFRILSPHELSEAQQAILQSDIERGLPSDHRVMMRREL